MFRIKASRMHSFKSRITVSQYAVVKRVSIIRKVGMIKTGRSLKSMNPVKVNSCITGFTVRKDAAFFIARRCSANEFLRRYLGATRSAVTSIVHY